MGASGAGGWGCSPSAGRGTEDSGGSARNVGGPSSALALLRVPANSTTSDRPSNSTTDRAVERDGRSASARNNEGVKRQNEPLLHARQTVHNEQRTVHRKLVAHYAPDRVACQGVRFVSDNCEASEARYVLEKPQRNSRDLARRRQANKPRDRPPVREGLSCGGRSARAARTPFDIAQGILREPQDGAAAFRAARRPGPGAEVDFHPHPSTGSGHRPDPLPSRERGFGMNSRCPSFRRGLPGRRERRR